MHDTIASVGINRYVHAEVWEPRSYEPNPRLATQLRRIRPPRRVVHALALLVIAALLILSAGTIYGAARAVCTIGAAPGSTCSEVLYEYGTPV